MKTILIVGAGNIAYFYIQAILAIKLKIKIIIYDNKKSQIIKFKKRLNKKIKNIIFTNSIKKNSYDVDLAIISTTSTDRALIVTRFLKLLKIKKFLIEKVAEQSIQNLNILKKISKKKKTFFSLPRRCSKFYQYLKKKKKKKIFKLIATSARIDLASNGIHLLDIVSWILSKKVKFIDTTNIIKWLPSKRKNYKEFIGTVIVYFSKNQYLQLENTFNRDTIIKIIVNKDLYTSDINNEIFFKNSKSVNISNRILISYIMQTEIKKILLNKKTYLPKYHEIHYNHAIFIKSLLMSYNKINSSNIKKLPIT